jgi:acyl carrier protein
MHKEKILTYLTTEIAPDVKPDEIASDYDLFEGGILDSLTMVRMIAWLGETYDIPVNEIDIVPADLHTVAGINSFVTAQTDSKIRPEQRRNP